MASLNVNSLIAKIDEIQLLVQNEKIDILAINETKIDHKIEDRLISLEDFSLCRYDRSRQGGGVALYVRNAVRFKPRENLPNKSLELICIEVEPPNLNPFIVIAWYRPPSKSNSCFVNLDENLSFLDGEGKEIIILGDTNCDICHRDTTPSHVVQLRELYDLFDMKQIIKEPTRVTLDSSTLIDHIATTSCNNITESGVLNIGLSDHYLVYCVRKLRGGVKHQHKYFTSRQLKNFNQEAFPCNVDLYGRQPYKSTLHHHQKSYRVCS